MLLFPIPETALATNIRTWLAGRTETFLTGFTVGTVWPDDLATRPRFICVEPGTAQGQNMVDVGMVTLTVLAAKGDYSTVIQAAQYLKAALPGLTGNGIAALTRVLGPTAASDVTGRPKRVLSVNYVATATTLP